MDNNILSYSFGLTIYSSKQNGIKSCSLLFIPFLFPLLFLSNIPGRITQSRHTLNNMWSSPRNIFYLYLCRNLLFYVLYTKPKDIFITILLYDIRERLPKGISYFYFCACIEYDFSFFKQSLLGTLTRDSSSKGKTSLTSSALLNINIP